MIRNDIKFRLIIFTMKFDTFNLVRRYEKQKKLRAWNLSLRTWKITGVHWFRRGSSEVW